MMRFKSRKNILLTSLIFFPALALNLLKGFLERSKIFFNRFRTSAAEKSGLDEINAICYKRGFTLIEVMMAMMIASLTLTPLFMIFSTILRRVNKSSQAYDYSLVCKNFLYEARQKQESEAQDFSLEKKEVEFDATLSYALEKSVPQGSKLKDLQGLHREIVTITFTQDGQKKQDNLVAFVYKKLEQKK